VTVDNRPGASANIGHEAAAKAAPDGYTILISSSSTLVNNVHLFKSLRYDPLGDFTPVSMVASAGQVLVVHPSVPAKDVSELVALARAQPGKLNFGSGGKGIQSHISGEMFKSAVGVDIVHIPYKGSSGARTDILGGQVQMMFDAITTMAPNVRAGKLRALATSGKVRSTVLPEVPTVSEAGVPGYEAVIWLGIMAPTGTPRAIVEKLNVEITRIANAPEMKAGWAKQGAVAMSMTPEEFGRFMREDIEKWARIVKISGARPDQ